MSAHSFNESISIFESIEEPEKLDSFDKFTVEDFDGRTISVTQKVTTSKIKRIIYSDQVIFIHHRI